MNETHRPRTTEDTSFHEISGSTWLLTFSDLLTLLLTLFVMRYAMSTVDSTRWKTLTSSVRSAMHAPTAQQDNDSTNATILKLGKKLEHIVPKSSDGIVMTLRERKKSISIELSGSLFFGDTEELTFSGKERLLRIAATLRDQPVALEITAHATMNSNSDSRFVSPWDLSAAWAAVTARQMIDAGIAASVISAAGLADIQQDEDRELKKPSRRIEMALALRE